MSLIALHSPSSHSLTRAPRNIHLDARLSAFGAGCSAFGRGRRRARARPSRGPRAPRRRAPRRRHRAPLLDAAAAAAGFEARRAPLPPPPPPASSSLPESESSRAPAARPRRAAWRRAAPRCSIRGAQPEASTRAIVGRACSARPPTHAAAAVGRLQPVAAARATEEAAVGRCGPVQLLELLLHLHQPPMSWADASSVRSADASERSAGPAPL